MPTSKRRARISIDPPPDLRVMLEREAQFTNRPVANQVVYIVGLYFAEKKKDLDYFRQTQSHLEGLPKPHVFDRPAPQELGETLDVDADIRSKK
jgi:hypothetical protein